MYSASEHSSSKDGQDCSWVQHHLGVYDLWDDTLSLDEFEAIETHLHHCSDCVLRYGEIRTGREIIEMFLAGKSPDEWEQDKKDYGQHILAKLRDSGFLDEEVEYGECSNINELSITQISETKWRFASLGTAVAFVLFIALPVLAYVGSVLLQDTQGSLTTNEGVEEIVLGNTEGIGSSLQSPPEDEAVTWGNLSTEVEFTSILPLDQITNQAVLQAELDALFPSTEEEYQAWARKEYPHIMALYDILIQVDSDTPNAIPLWDGQPVNIPQWGQTLYENTPEAERPTHWKSLLIYSGEIFKFDCPETLKEPNANPSHQAIQIASSVAGYDLSFGNGNTYPLPPLEFIEDDNGVLLYFELIPSDIPVDFYCLELKLPSGYLEKLASNKVLATSVLTYIYVSSKLTHLDNYNKFSELVKDDLAELCNISSTQCEPRIWEIQTSLFDNRFNLVNSVNNYGKGNR